MNKYLLTFAVLFSSVFAGHASANIAISVPITNSGAETGDLSGWSGGGYVSINNAVEANTGSHFFGFDTSALSIESLDRYVGGARIDKTIDISDYLGRIEKLTVSGWYRNSDLTLRLENFNKGEIASYGFRQMIRYRARDINGATLFPRVGGMLSFDRWGQRIGDLSFWGNWDTYKSSIETVTISVFTELMLLDPQEGISFFDLNLASFDNAYFEWSHDGVYETTDDFSMINVESAPVIGFDDIELHLELAPVPVPAGLWLFFTAMTGLVFARKKA